MMISVRNKYKILRYTVQTLRFEFLGTKIDKSIDSKKRVLELSGFEFNAMNK